MYSWTRWHEEQQLQACWGKYGKTGESCFSWGTYLLVSCLFTFFRLTAVCLHEQGKMKRKYKRSLSANADMLMPVFAERNLRQILTRERVPHMDHYRQSIDHGKNYYWVLLTARRVAKCRLRNYCRKKSAQNWHIHRTGVHITALHTMYVT